MSIQPVQSTQTYSPAKKAAKTVAKAAVVTAAVATTLALGAKSGRFTVNEKTNKVMAKALPYLEKAGNFINNKAEKLLIKLLKQELKIKLQIPKYIQKQKKKH